MKVVLSIGTLCLLSLPSLFAQTPAAPSRVELMVEFLNDVLQYDPDDENSTLQGDSIGLVVFIGIPSGESATKLNLKAGTSNGAGDIQDFDFDYVSGSGLPTGVSYQVTNGEVRLDLGDYTGIPDVHVEVSLENSGGQKSSVKTSAF